MEETPEGFIDLFRTIPDHRIERTNLYPVEELLLVTFCGVIAGCDGWDDLELFGETKLDYFQRYLPFKHGAPNDDTLRRFSRALDPERFEACFLEWITSVQLDLTHQVVAIDGKTSRRSAEGENRAFHMIRPSPVKWDWYWAIEGGWQLHRDHGDSAAARGSGHYRRRCYA